MKQNLRKTEYRWIKIVCGLLLILLLTACGESQPQVLPSEETTTELQTQEAEQLPEEEQVLEPEQAVENAGDNTEAEGKMIVQIGDTEFTATLEENAAVDALVEMMQAEPVVIQMSDYAGFEKVGSLGTSLPTSNKQTTTHAGDIVLYNGNQIVIFYGSNSWSYTRLAKIDDLTGWEDALGDGDVTVTFLYR